MGLAIILLVICGAIASCVMVMAGNFERAVAPEMLEKAKTAGRTINSLLNQAASHDIAPEKLEGVRELFAETAKKHPELAKFELTKNNKTLFGHDTTVLSDGSEENNIENINMATRLPVAGYELAADGTTHVANAVELFVSIDPNFIRKLFREMTLDLIVVVVVTLFISLELLYFMAGSLVADLARVHAQITALSRGAFIKLPISTWLGVDLSRALAACASQMTSRYQDAEVKFRLAMIKREKLGEARLKQLTTTVETMRAEFSFGDARGSTRGSGGSIESALMLGSMRAPFFLLLLADDLSRSFLPVFATEVSQSVTTIGPVVISPNLVASLPIFLFMLIVALSQPLLGGWSERIGRRRSFLAGAGVACVAHLLAAQSGSLLELLVWRSAGGAAWAIGFVAAQGYLLDATDSKTRTAGLATFVGVIMVSLICGPSIGGLLADGLGHRLTLALGGAVTAISFVLAWRNLPYDCVKITAVAEKTKPNGVSHIAQILTNRRFLMLLLFAAVPAKVILIAYCYYLIPLYVTGAGSTSAMAGRIIMLYSVMMVLLVPVMANWVVTLRARYQQDQQRPEALFVATGLALSGLAGIAMAIPLLSTSSPSSLGLLGPFIVVLMLGLGQALSISPQAAMVAELCQNEIRQLGQSAVYGVYRMIERLGNAIGPLIAAALLEVYGFGTAFVAIGVGVLLCAVLFAIVFLRSSVSVKNETADYAK